MDRLIRFNDSQTIISFFLSFRSEIIPGRKERKLEESTPKKNGCF